MSHPRRAYLRQQVAAFVDPAEVKAEMQVRKQPRVVCGYCQTAEPDEVASTAICAACLELIDLVSSVRLSRLARQRAAADSKHRHHCPRCDYWRERNRPCPHSPEAIEVARNYGWL